MNNKADEQVLRPPHFDPEYAALLARLRSHAEVAERVVNSGAAFDPQFLKVLTRDAILVAIALIEDSAK